MNEHAAARYGPWIAGFITVVGLLLFATSLGYTTFQNRERIDENTATAFALCDAAAGARDFWIEVRNSTVMLLEDPTLSPIERASNEAYLKSLNRVITAAGGVASSCDGRERP